MMKLNVRAAWPGPRGLMQPGVYAIPADISKVHAKCCVADGAGEIVQGAAERGAAPFREPPKPKGTAPENKARGRAPSRKLAVE